MILILIPLLSLLNLFNYFFPFYTVLFLFIFYIMVFSKIFEKCWVKSYFIIEFSKDVESWFLSVVVNADFKFEKGCSFYDFSLIIISLNFPRISAIDINSRKLNDKLTKLTKSKLVWRLIYSSKDWISSLKWKLLLLRDLSYSLLDNLSWVKLHIFMIWIARCVCLSDSMKPENLLA